MEVSQRLDTCDNGQDNVVSSTGEGRGRSVVKINEYHAAWNITNAIQSLFIVYLPFAILRGGYWAILAMAGFAQISCYTGKILVQCLYEADPTTGEMVRVRDSYVSIAKVCLGPKYGARAVNITQIIELLMTCILYVIICGDILADTYYKGPLDNKSWMMVTGIFLVPFAFLKSLRMVSLLSFWCTMSHLLINAVILGYCFSDISNWGWSKVRWSIDKEYFPICLSIISFSYTSHIFLPILEGNMKDKSKFNCMLNWCYTAAAFFNILFGYICFLTFQNDINMVIVGNLKPHSFRDTISFFFLIKLILSYPLPYYAVCELLERNFFRGPPKTKLPSIWDMDGKIKLWGLSFRIAVIIGTVLMGMFIPYIPILLDLIGSFTSAMLSFILPCYFHIRIKGHCLSQKTIAYDYFIIFLGVLFAVAGIYESASTLSIVSKIAFPF